MTASYPRACWIFLIVTVSSWMSTTKAIDRPVSWAKLRSTKAKRNLQDSSPLDVFDTFKNTDSFQSNLASPSAGTCLGGQGSQRTGTELQKIINCDSIPVGYETNYNLLTFAGFGDWLQAAGLDVNDVVGDLFGFPLLDAALDIADVTLGSSPGNLFPASSAEEWLDDIGASDTVLRDQLQNAANGVLFTPLCLVCNDGMFAIRTVPGFPYEKPCVYKDGLKLGDIPQFNTAVRLKFAGLGVAWESGNNLVYGTARNTAGGVDNNAPTVYDGLAQIPIVVEDVNFWLSVNLNFIDLAKHNIEVAKCNADPGDQFPEVSERTLSFSMTLDLYIKASSEEPCVLVAMPVAQISGFGLLPGIDVGAGLGGYCRLPDDQCSPDGFFVNLYAAPKLAVFPSGILGTLFGFTVSGLPFPNFGASLGFFLDKQTGAPTGGLIKVFMESPKIFGLSLGPSLSVEFQYISSEEFERRRESITTTDPSNPASACSRYRDCKVWKRYRLVNAQGEEVLDDKGLALYRDRYICASVLEDKSEITGVGRFNRKLLAKIPKSESHLRNEKNPSPSEWHVQDFFQGFDMFVASIAVEIPLRIPFISMTSVELTLILFGNIQPAVDPEADFPDEAYRLAVCELAAENDRLYVYVEVEASINVASIISFDGRLTIGNVPVTPASELNLPANANKWILAAFAELFVVGLRMTVTADAEWIYIDKDNARRRLQEDVCADVTRRRTREDPEHWHRSLQESIPITDAPISYGISLNCDGFLDCAGAVAEYVIGVLNDALTLLLVGLGKLVDFAEQAFVALVDFLDGALDYLGLGFLADAFEEVWEDVGEAWNSAISSIDNALSDGFQFKDLANIGLAIIKGVGDTALAVLNGFLGTIGIGIGVERSVPRIKVGTTVFGCTKWQDRVEKCLYCAFRCRGCRIRNTGPEYIDPPCLENAARSAAEGQQKKDEVDKLAKDKRREEEEDNKGYYTYVQDKCKSGASEDCSIAAPVFEVGQVIDRHSSRRLQGAPSKISFTGSQLQGDSDQVMDQQSLQYDNSLDFSSSPPECDPDDPKFDPNSLVETDNGTKICRFVQDNMSSWFETEALQMAAGFAQGTAKGIDSPVAEQFITQADWLAPSISLADESASYYLEISCDDPILQVNGIFTNNPLLNVDRLQTYALEEAGLDVILDQNLRGTEVSGRWDTIEWIESCAYTKYVKKYTVSDVTGKVSNPIEFVFQVNLVAPELVFDEPLASSSSTCHERGSVTPSEDNELRIPSVSGGCFSEAFGIVSFVDTISTSYSENGRCSVSSIQREWSLLAPFVNGTEAHDDELFANPECGSLLVSLVSPIEETISLCEQDQEDTKIPDQCMSSPLRITGFEDLSISGLPRVNILTDRLNSLQRDEFLSVSNSTLAIIESIAAEVDVTYTYQKQVVEGSLEILRTNNVQEASPVLESVFYIDDNAIRHGVIPPDALGEYVDLCQEDTIVSLRVKARRGDSKSSKSSGSSNRGLRHQEKNVFEKNYEEFVLCFQAVCDSHMDESVMATNGRRALSARRDQHVRQMKEDSVTAPAKPSRDDVWRMLQDAPSVDVYARAKEEIARNLAHRRRLKEAGLLES